jgi:proteasome lid subunit RPN8/RPN11
MRITQPMFDEIVAHAIEDLPDECCGMVSGKDGTATEVFRARNELASPFSYSVDSRDLLRITGLIDERGEELAAIYHSHTKTAPEPSQTDINLAKMWPDPVYLICSIADRDAPLIRGWEIRGGAVREVELLVE